MVSQRKYPPCPRVFDFEFTYNLTIAPILMAKPMQLVLASGSSYRKQLLEKLGLPVKVCPPNVDETPLPDEAPANIALRLAINKAEALVPQFEQLPEPHWIIGSDQVCEVDGLALGKPGTRDNAIEQLRRCQGKKVTFYTGLALVDSHRDTRQQLVERYEVFFRPLSLAQISRYVDKEQPLDCAGSFKSEGLGVTLFERHHGRDPNCLIGLPLMALTDMLLAWDHPLP